MTQPGAPDEPVDRYEQLMQLADLFDAAGSEMRARAGLGERVLREQAVAESAELAPSTWSRFDDETRGATTGRHGLLARSEEHTSELQSRGHLVCRLLLEKKKK